MSDTILKAIPFSSALQAASPIATTQASMLPPEPVIFGRSAVMQQVRQDLEKVKGNNVPVLIQGESGTGKEVIAMFLHDRSPWSDGPLVKVSCPAIPSTLLESELFGYEKGAFTGAYASKPGRVEMAHRGTLFLDEIGDLDMMLQAKLLQLLQNGQFSRIGSQRDKTVDVRVVCATNRELAREILQGTFRQDLYYRINVLPIRLPALRERREDIRGLVDYFLETHNTKLKSAARPLSRSLMNLLAAYDWPGNIRQLENLVKRYVILGSEESVSRELLAVPANGHDAEIEIGDEPVSLKKIAQQASMACERRAILKALQVHAWNRKRAARSLSISYRAFLYKMRQAGLPVRSNNGQHEKNAAPQGVNRE
ncbi:MAG: sigma-54 interaction domain-containing protein [Terriglobia bacterium]